MKITIEAEVHTEHQAYATPRNPHELLDVLSRFVETKDFRWSIGNEPMHGTSEEWTYHTAPKRTWYRRILDF